MEYAGYYSAAAANNYVDISSSSKSAGEYNGGGYGGYNGGDGGNKKNIALIIASVVAAVLVAAIVVFFCFYFLKGEGETKKTADAPKIFEFSANTKVSGIDISGKTFNQAKQLLEQNKANFITPVSFTVKYGKESETLTQDDFKYEYDIDQVLTGIKAEEEAEEQAENDTDGTAPVHEYKVTATVTKKSIDEKAEEFCEDHFRTATNASVSAFHPYADKRFEYKEAVNGIAIDANDLNSQISAAFEEGKTQCELTPYTEEIPAEITSDYLKKNIVKLSSYETYSSNTENGTHNMKISLAACNGSIIGPGEVWSFNDCTGDSNLASNGYKPANVIVNGKIEQGNGGGICQSSSTIYNAAIRANMDIIERMPHEWASSYVPTGLDATIDYPNIDLKLENTSDYQMFLECKLDGYTLYVSFWGVKSSDYDEIKVRNELGKSSEKTYNVKAWRVYYKKDKKVKEEELPSSNYSLSHGKNFYSVS